MIVLLLTFAAGLLLLLVGGRLLVSAAEDAATRLGVSPLLVGLTLVAWGTSAPELALNLISASKGRSDLAIGNIVGANICNIALVLGACALVRPLMVQERLVRVEVLVNATMLAAFAGLGLSDGLGRGDAATMLCLFLAYSVWTVRAALTESRRAKVVATADDASWRDGVAADATRVAFPMGWTMIAACFVGGLVLLSVGGSLTSDGASGIAVALGAPASVVGVTVVSIGTTLPELVTGIIAVRRGRSELAMGNAIGSCLFNAGAIFGVVGLLAPPGAVGDLRVPMLYMAALGAALIPISRTADKTVSRWEGGLLVGSYAFFLAVLAVGAARHAP